MDESCDSEEFFDAEEFTPIKGSKRSSLNKSTRPSESEIKDKEKTNVSDSAIPSTSAAPPPAESQVSTDAERANVKNIVQDRKRFQELRRWMQTDEDDELPEPLSTDHQSLTTEQPFKVIAHDTMSLQSMTSLGRIGRILSGAADSHPNILESSSAPPMARASSTHSDDPLPDDRSQNVLAMAEPDVIASTKANSLKHSRSLAVDSVPACRAPQPAPRAPPRRKKRNKLYGSQSLSTTDGDNLSLCTNDTDDRSVAERPRPPPLRVLDEPSLSGVSGSQSMALPSPASTIESLTREFQDSLELSQTKYERSSERQSSAASSRSSTGAAHARPRLTHDDGRDASLPRDTRMSTGRTNSDARPATSENHSMSRSSESSRGGGRRRSAGDEQLVGASGGRRHPLTDAEILDQVEVLNLDTGERVPLSVAEHKLPQCINPLSLHIMRLTSEYVPDHAARETDDETESQCGGGAEDDVKEAKQDKDTDKPAAVLRKKTDKLKRFFGSTVKKTVDAAKTLAAEVSHARHKEDVADIPDDVRGEIIKLKASTSHKGPYDFDQCLTHVQEMESAHSGPIWCLKPSPCGRLLATAGQDKLLRVWVTRDAYPMLHDMRLKYKPEKKCSPTPSQESRPRCSPSPTSPCFAPPPPFVLKSYALTDMRLKYKPEKKCSPTPSQESLSSPAAPPSPDEPPLRPSAPFCPKPFCVYSGHTSDLLDVSWSKNLFVLSSSMDKTVRLWHVCRGECLCCFQHIDFVTAIVFHPRDDRYFLSGSLDGKLRLWDIPDKKVAVWNEVDGKTKLITAANFCQNGKFAVVGTYDGRCIFYTTDQLKYHTQIDVRSSRGKNRTGRKISGIEPMPNDDKILITSNDSRIRLYDLRDLNLSCKYRGYVNVSSQIRASFSHDGKYVVSGSENQCIYIWKTYHDYSKFTSVRRDRNDFWEGIKAHNAVVTCAVFAPNPDHFIKMIQEREQLERPPRPTNEQQQSAEGGMVASSQTGHVLVSADYNGCVKVFVHKARPKHSSLPASALADGARA